MASKKSTSSVTDAKIQQAYNTFSASTQKLDDVRMAHATMAQSLDGLGIHRGALKQVHKLLKMDVAKAQDFMASFNRYSEVLGLDEKLESQPSLPVNEQPAAEPEEAAAFH